MADRKRLTALKALDLLQNIQEDDSDAEIDIQSCEDIYDSHEDNCDELESEFSSDNESLVSESTNSDISDFVDTETNSETDENQDLQNNTISLATFDRTAWDFWTLFKIIPDGNLTTIFSEKHLGHLLKQSIVFSKNWFAVHGIYSLIKVCSVTFKDVQKKKPLRVLQTDDWRVSLYEWMHF